MRTRCTTAAAVGVLSAVALTGMWVSGAGGGAAASAATTSPAPEVLVLVLDASGSMLEPDGAGGTRIESARTALTGLVDQLPGQLQVGLRVFGHRVPSADKAAACQDTELVAPIAPLDAALLKSRINGIQALGETPIGLSLRLAAEDLPPGSQGTVVLVSDGADECFPDLGPEPCQVARDLVTEGVDLRVEVVGLQVEPGGRDQLACMAEATGGSFTNIDDLARLGEALSDAQQRGRRVFEIRGEPVAGGPALIDATPLTPGTYSDGIIAGDVLWYAVDATTGQELTARLTVAATGVPAGATVDLTWSDESAATVEEETLVTTGTGQAATTAVSTGEVNGSRTRFGAIRDAGTYYLSVTTQGFPPEVTKPYVLEIRSEDLREPASPTSSGPPSDAGTTAAAAAAVELPPRSADSGGGGVAFVIALLAIAGGAGYLYLRRRATRAAGREEPPGYA